MENEIGRREFLKGVAVTGVYLGLTSVPFISGCGRATFDNIKIESAKSRGYRHLQPSQNPIYYHVDKLKIPRIIVDLQDLISLKKGGKKGGNLYRLKNTVELVPPKGSKRIWTRKGLEEVTNGIYYKPLEIITTISPKSKEEIIAGYAHEGRDPDQFDGKYSKLEAERLSWKKILLDVKYYEERKEGGDGGNGGNGGNGGGVGGGGGTGGSGGG
ncbi:twin-arginine translocation signal domain-containing protein [archaeon]|nr:twin-arginine translocation signal domain-containing protein [archaeon]